VFDPVWLLLGKMWADTVWRWVASGWPIPARRCSFSVLTLIAPPQRLPEYHGIELHSSAGHRFSDNPGPLLRQNKVTCVLDQIAEQNAPEAVLACACGVCVPHRYPCDQYLRQRVETGTL
jgi:hypothetical protein